MEISKYKDSKFLEQYEERVEAHRLCPYPKIIEMLGDISTKDVLDVGCGQGELAKEMAEQGGRVTGVDISQEWIDICRERYASVNNLNFMHMNGTDMSQFQDGRFDAVTMNMVLLNVQTKKEVKKIFSEISRVLNPEGMLIFSDLHPICIMNPSPPRFQNFGKNFSYFRNGAMYRAGIALKDGGIIEFKDKHWTLEAYTQLLAESGMYIRSIAEPTYGKNAPEIFRKIKTPEYILFECRKLGR